MQTKRNRLSSFFLISFLFLAQLLGTNSPAAAETGKKIAILPFEVLAAKDLAYLKEGVRIMLASRLAAGAGVAVVDKARVDQALVGSAAPSPAQMQALGQRLGADYLLAGNLTAMGGVSLDAKVYSVADGTAQNFFATAAKEDEVIGAVDHLAWDVAAKIFGATPPAAMVQAAVPAGIAAPAAAVPYQSEHPERVFAGQENGARYGNGVLVRPGGIGGRSGFVKSQNFRMGLRAMDVGDVDGDGKDELALADAHQVTVYRREQNRLIPMAPPITTLNLYRIHGVSMGDCNGNGKAELYISAAGTKNPNSLAVEWDGKEFAPLFKEVRWYIRALPMPGQGMILAGQKAAVDGPVMPGIYRLEGKGGAVQEQEQLAVPDSVNLFDFSVADLDGDGLAEVIAIDQHDRLRVMRPSGKLLWKSDEYYGGTTRFIGGQEAMDIAGRSVALDDLGRIYVPSRVVIADVNGDGLPDVVLNKNLSTSSRIFKNMKSYPSGEIHALTWNGIGLTELWRTRKIDGYIADYQLRPDPAGATAELSVGVVLRAGVGEILSDEESTVLTYQLAVGSDQEGENGPESAKP